MGMVVACAGYENGVRIADLSIQQSGAFARVIRGLNSTNSP